MLDTLFKSIARAGGIEVPDGKSVFPAEEPRQRVDWAGLARRGWHAVRKGLREVSDILDHARTGRGRHAAR